MSRVGARLGQGLAQARRGVARAGGLGARARDLAVPRVGLVGASRRQKRRRLGGLAPRLQHLGAPLARIARELGLDVAGVVARARRRLVEARLGARRVGARVRGVVPRLDEGVRQLRRRRLGRGRLALQPVGLGLGRPEGVAVEGRRAAQLLELLLHIPRRGLRRRRVGLGRAESLALGLGRRQRALQGRFRRVRRRHMGVDLGPRRGGVGARLVGGRLGRAAGLAFRLRRRAHALELGFRGPRCRLVRLELGPDALEQPPRPVRVGARLLGRRLGRS